MLEDAIKEERKLSLCVLSDVLDELVIDFLEGDILMVADIPCKVRIFSSTLLIGVGL